MLDGLPAELLQLSPLGALIAFIAGLGWLISRGYLRTQREFDQMEKQHGERVKTILDANLTVVGQLEDRIEEYKEREGKLSQRGDDWKAAYQSSELASTELRENVFPLIAEVGRTTKHVIESLPSPANGGHTEHQETP